MGRAGVLLRPAAAQGPKPWPWEHAGGVRVAPRGRGGVLGAALCCPEGRDGRTDGWREGRRRAASPSRGSPLCPRAPPRAPTPPLEGFPPTLASASPRACRRSSHQHPSSLDKRRTSGKIGKCESSVITMSRGGRFMQTFISFSISSPSYRLLF